MELLQRLVKAEEEFILKNKCIPVKVEMNILDFELLCEEVNALDVKYIHGMIIKLIANNSLGNIKLHGRV